MSIANRDLRLWLSSKLEDAWSSTNINMNSELLDKLLEDGQFSSLDTPIKLKILFALLNSKKNVLMEQNEKIVNLLGLALKDPVDWVKVISSILIQVDQGTLALEELHSNQVFQGVYNQIKDQLKHPLAFCPLQSPYLSPSLFENQGSSPMATSMTQNHFTLVKKTPRFTPAVPQQKSSLQKIIQSQTRTTTNGITGGTKTTTASTAHVLNGNKTTPTTSSSTSALRNSGSLLTTNKPSTPSSSNSSRPATTLPLLRKSTPVNTSQQNNTNTPPIKTNILKQSLNPGRLTSTPIIDVVDTAEIRQKKIEKEERMREAGKNESKKRTRNPSTEQQPTKNVKRMPPFTPSSMIPGIPDPTHMNFVPPMFSKEKTDPPNSSLEPLQDKANSSAILFYVWQK